MALQEPRTRSHGARSRYSLYWLLGQQATVNVGEAVGLVWNETQ